MNKLGSFLTGLTVGAVGLGVVSYLVSKNCERDEDLSLDISEPDDDTNTLADFVKAEVEDAEHQANG